MRQFDRKYIERLYQLTLKEGTDTVIARALKRHLVKKYAPVKRKRR